MEQLLEEAKMLRKTWRYKEALSSYEEVLDRTPDCIAAHYGRCKMLRALSRRREALLAYDELLQLDPTSVRAHVGKAWVLVDLRRYEEALAAFAHNQVGDILSKLERYADAVKAYNQAIRLRPDFTGEYSSKAHALEKLGRYEEALAAYNKALQLSPKQFFLLFARADVLKKLLRYEEANAKYDRAQLVAPNPWFAAYVVKKQETCAPCSCTAHSAVTCTRRVLRQVFYLPWTAGAC